jgi:hypothetical protein
MRNNNIYRFPRLLPMISLSFTALAIIGYIVQGGFYGGEAYCDLPIYYLLWPGFSLMALLYSPAFHGYPDILLVIFIPGVINFALSIICAAFIEFARYFIGR